MAKIDRPILLEIVRVIREQAKVPDLISIQKRAFSITYLDDHRQRIEDAVRRQDGDRLNMLFGQLESKVKYQAIRAPKVPVGASKAVAAEAKSAPRSKSSSGSHAPARRAAVAEVTAPKRGAKVTKPKATRATSRGTLGAGKSRKVAARSKNSKSSPRR